MPVQRLVDFGGKPQAFPADATDAEISAALGAIPSSNAKESPQAKTWTALSLSAAKSAVPAAARLAEEVATNPNIPKAAATAGRVLGGVAPIVGGAASGGPVGGLVGVAAASKGAWAGGRTGWFTGKLAQGMAAPIAAALEKAAPYAQALGTASGAQGALDLAQIAEPTRKDIGVLGIGRTADVLKDPAAVNRLIEASPSIGDAIANLMQLGMPQGEAVRTVMNYRVKAQK